MMALRDLCLRDAALRAGMIEDCDRDLQNITDANTKHSLSTASPIDYCTRTSINYLLLYFQLIIFMIV